MTLSTLKSTAKHSMALIMQCAFFRYPIVEWEKGAAKICCLELEIVIPGYSNDPGAISQYMSTFNQLFGLLKGVSTVRILLRVHKDQKLSRNGTISHEEYLYTFFNSLGRYMPSIRQLTVIIISERNAEHRKIQIEGVRGRSQQAFSMQWRDSCGAFDSNGKGVKIILRNINGDPVCDSDGSMIRYCVGGVLRDANGKVLLDDNKMIIRDTSGSDIRDSNGNAIQVEGDGTLVDRFGVTIKDATGAALRIANRGQLADAAGNVLVAHFAAVRDPGDQIRHDARGNVVLSIPGPCQSDACGIVLLNDNTWRHDPAIVSAVARPAATPRAQFPAFDVQPSALVSGPSFAHPSATVRPVVSPFRSSTNPIPPVTPGNLDDSRKTTGPSDTVYYEFPSPYEPFTAGPGPRQDSVITNNQTAGPVSNGPWRGAAPTTDLHDLDFYRPDYVYQHDSRLYSSNSRAIRARNPSATRSPTRRPLRRMGSTVSVTGNHSPDMDTGAPRDLMASGNTTQRVIRHMPSTGRAHTPTIGTPTTATAYDRPVSDHVNARALRRARSNLHGRQAFDQQPYSMP
ncbi:hypothetical protein UCRNP2_108 [Neofusicoccum parvum UCRNP2]|uniref:Uncharacterized protein n=1 Tax=Botryosphaeria parva (strain UCR-NP2) TaxID=1287680 RepID=R1GN33_BOTPV|nr:hypothetical protein UCRNP2_108 [Neofusicoccum parvum UCRNP2]